MDLKIDNFQLEIYDTIFKHLRLTDIVRLRAVCKKLRSFVKLYEIKEIHIWCDSSFMLKLLINVSLNTLLKGINADL